MVYCYVKMCLSKFPGEAKASAEDAAEEELSLRLFRCRVGLLLKILKCKCKKHRQY